MPQMLRWAPTGDRVVLRRGRLRSSWEWDRIRAAYAPASAAFGAPQTLSPIGTVLSEDDSAQPVAALAPDGRRLAAWNTDPTAATGARTLAAIGHASPDPVVAGPSTAPRVRLWLTRAALRRAVNGTPLRARVWCSRYCAVRVSLLPGPFGGDEPTRTMFGLRSVLAGPGRSRPVRWILTALQRRQVRGMLRQARDLGLVADADAIDGAGNVRTAERLIEHPRSG
jgi:hypothetical protein